MKYALIFGLVGLVFWFWRSQRLSRRNETSGQYQRGEARTLKASGKATEMVACGVCHLHMPRHEALPGKSGQYCSAAHKQQAGD